MATWTPGSYLIREYERHVEAVTATAAGRALNVEKSTKNRWRIATGGAPSVTLRYKVYSREMTVRNNWVESGFAMINGAPTFLTLVERAARPHEVRVRAARRRWKNVRDRRCCRSAGSANTFRAADFDTIIDSPIIIGNPVTREFTVDGKKSRRGVRRRCRDDRRRQRRGRRAEDGPGRQERDGLAAVSALLLHDDGHGAERRARAQEQLPGHDRPLCHADPRRLLGLARHARARVLPRLERQAPPPDGARPVRLRERELRERRCGSRRASPITTPTSCRGAPAITSPATNFSTACRATSNRCKSCPDGW